MKLLNPEIRNSVQSLKIFIVGNSELAKDYREAERHHLENGRKLIGWKGASKKHKKDEPKKAREVNTGRMPLDVENIGQYANEAYLKYWNLHHTRAVLLRKMQRNALLAYAFCRGVPYETAEASGTYRIPDFDAVREIAFDNFEGGANAFEVSFAAWRTDAEKLLGVEVVKDEPSQEVA